MQLHFTFHVSLFTARPLARYASGAGVPGAVAPGVVLVGGGVFDDCSGLGERGVRPSMMSLI